MTDHRAWAKMLAEKALARFGARVWFMGLQGSVRRGAATESSDIDFVLILDRLDTADLSAYRELVRSMPDSDLSSRLPGPEMALPRRPLSISASTASCSMRFSLRTMMSGAPSSISLLRRLFLLMTLL